MDKFSWAAFMALDARRRKLLCVELALYLKSNLLSHTKDLGYGGEREELVYTFLDRLKALGHEIYSWDCNIDSDIFGYDYIKGGGFGLILEFDYPESVEVYWKEEGGTHLYY